jgi:hypothetical protein
MNNPSRQANINKWKREHRQQMNAAQKKYRQQHKGVHSAEVKAYYRRYPSKLKAKVASYILRNRSKYLCRRRFDYAVRSGKLARPSNCQCCGVGCIPHGHHTDYTKPFEVEWLCVDCHLAAHRKETKK